MDPRSEAKAEIPQDMKDKIANRFYSFTKTARSALERLEVYRKKNIRDNDGESVRRRGFTTPGRIEAYNTFHSSLREAELSKNIEVFRNLFNSAVNVGPRDNTSESIKRWEAENFCTYVPGIKEKLGKKELYACVTDISQIFIERIKFFEKFKEQPDLVISVLEDNELREALDPEDIGEILKPWFDKNRNSNEDLAYQQAFLNILNEKKLDSKKIISNEIPPDQLLKRLSILCQEYSLVFIAYDRISKGCGEEADRERFEERKAIMKKIEEKITALASGDPAQMTNDKIELYEQELVQNFGAFVDGMFEIFLEAPETATLYGFIPRLRLMLYQAFAVPDVEGDGPFFDRHAIRKIHDELVVQYRKFINNPREYAFFEEVYAKKHSIRRPCFVSEAKNERPFADLGQPEYITPLSLTQFAARWKKACEARGIPEPFALQKLIQAINNIKANVHDNKTLSTGWCDQYIKPILNNIVTYSEMREGLTNKYISRLSRGTVSEKVNNVGLSPPKDQDVKTEAKISVLNLQQIVNDYDKGRDLMFFSKSDGVGKIRLAYNILETKYNKDVGQPLDSDDVDMLESVLVFLNDDKEIQKNLETLIKNCKKNFPNESRPEARKEEEKRFPSPGK